MTIILYLLCKIWTIIACARFFLQKGGLYNSHPLAKFCSNSTDFIIKKVRKYIQPVDGWDISIIAVVYGCYFIFHIIELIVEYFLNGYTTIQVNIVVYIIVATILDTSYSFCYSLIIAIILYIISTLSEVITPLTQILYNILSPLSKLLGNIKIGGLNISLSIILILLMLWVYGGIHLLFNQLRYG